MSTRDEDNDITLASYERAVDRYLEHSSPPGPEMVRYLDRYADLVGSGRVLEDGLLADAVLLHMSRPQLKELLHRARSAVSDGGVLGLTLKEGDGSAWTTDKLDQPRHFTYWRERALRDVLTQTGWTVRHLHHVAGRHEPWLYVCALASQQE